MRYLLSVLIALSLGVAGCAFLRIRSPSDFEAFLGMASECHPVWKQFALRRYGPGDKIEAVLSRFTPTRRIEFGRYGVYSFAEGPSNSISFTGLSVVSRDGKLLSAASGSCTWQFTFFDVPDPDLARQYTAFVQSRHHQLEQARLERLADKLSSFFHQYHRWPTNETEFGGFVTGNKPAAQAPNVTRRSKFLARYGLGKGGFSDPSANPLGITFSPAESGGLIIALNGEPELVQTVDRPNH